MKWDTVQELLRRLGIPTKPLQVSGIWHNVQCPFAPFYHKKGIDSHPSFGITVTEKGRSYYKCLSCQQRGSLALLPAKLGKLRKIDYSEIVHWAETCEFEDTGPPAVPSWESGNTTKIVNQHVPTTAAPLKKAVFGGVIGHPYLRKRGYTIIDAVRLDLRYDEIQQRILFPVYNQLLQIEGFTGRSVMSDKFITKGKGNNPKSRDYHGLQKERLMLFNRRWYKNNKRNRIIIVEGPFDYARCVQAGYLGTHAIMGTALTDAKIDYFIELNRPVTLFFDNDVAGKAAMFGNTNNETGLLESTHLAWAERLYKHVPVWIAPYTDYAEQEGRNDPDSLSCWEIRHSLSKSWLYRGIFDLPQYKELDYEIPF